MQVDAIALKLRPRGMTEAADLGVRLVQAHAASVWRTWLAVYLPVALLCLSTVEFATWLPTVLLFCLKPWLDRSLLFVLSRAVFGEATRFADLWRAQRQAWWSDLGRSLLLRRLSPWRAYTQPIHQLEGQRGAARRQRRKQLLAGRSGAALRMHLVFAHVEAFLCMAVFALAVWFTPENDGLNLMQWVFQEDSAASSLVTAGIYAAVVMLLEPFYVSAGFVMYLNRRVELEAWDIEQEFRHAFAG